MMYRVHLQSYLSMGFVIMCYFLMILVGMFGYTPLDLKVTQLQPMNIFLT